MRPRISRLLFPVAILTSFLALGLSLSLAGDPVSSEVPADIYVIRIEGAVSPGTAGFLKSSIAQAHKAGAQALLIELDTPGGLGESMRTMVKEIMNAPFPIIVYVSPTGARAASAGVLITMAADVAAMAPGTNIGAAHPVSAGGQNIAEEMEKKVMNDMIAFAQGVAKQRGRNVVWVKQAIEFSVSVTASEAVQLKVVDLVAGSRSELLEKINGRRISRPGLEVTLITARAKVVELQESLRDRVLRVLADPNIAYILMMIGLAGLYFEFSNPGAIFPGVIGGMALILAFYSFQTLPVNYAGILLIIMGIVLFILEIKITSYGMLSIGGLISLTLGSLMLFESPQGYLRVSYSVMLPVLSVVGGFFLVVTWLVIKAQVQVSPAGYSGLLGLQGPVKEWKAGQGRVYVHGEWWHADSDDDLAPGDRIEVIQAKGMHLKVRRVQGPKGSI